MPNYSVLYRLTGGEVLKIAKAKPDGSVQQFAERDQTQFGVAIDPIIENEATLRTNLETAEKAYNTLLTSALTRIAALGVLVPTPVEEATEISLRDQVATRRAAFLSTPTPEAKNLLTAAQQLLQKHMTQVGGRIDSDKDALLSDVERVSLQKATDTMTAAQLAWQETIQVVDQSVNPVGPRRVLGIAKIYDSGTNTVRVATQKEIDAWATAEAEDQKTADASQAKEFLLSHPQFRKMFMLIFKAINRTRVDAGLTPFTRQQIVTFINANVDRED